MLGTGAMGQVWLAVGPTGPVAVKRVMDSSAWRGAHAQLLRAEMQLAATLDHPNIARLVDAGTVTAAEAAAAPDVLQAGGPWVAMELAAGPLSEARPHTLAEARAVLGAVLAALAHAHARDVVHRDIKPENVLRHPDPDRAWMLGDFGLAVARGELSDAVHGGTPGYAAPEQRRRELHAQGPWSDLYAVGALACWLLTGDPDGWPEMLPARWLGWLGWLRELEPARRCRHAADAATALAELPDVDVALPLHAVVAPHSGATTLDWLDDAPIEIAVEMPPPPAVTPPWSAWAGATPPLAVGPGIVRARRAPLVGREAEQAQLWSALRDAHEGKGPVFVAIHGSAGVGCSRLAQWVGERADELGLGARFVARHSPLEDTGSGLPGLVAGALGVEGLDQPEPLRMALGATPPVEVGPLVELLCPGVARVHLAHPKRAHEVVSETIGALSGDRVAVVWLDDVQWGAESLRWTVEGLEPAGTRVLVVCTVLDEVLTERPVEAERLAQLPNLRELRLGPLSEHDATRLAAAVIDLAPDTARRLAGHTAGAPTFLTQLMRSWADEGLARTADGFRPDASGWLPDLDAVWHARIARVVADVGGAAQAALEIACCLGEHIDDREWAAACVEASVERPPTLIPALLDSGLLSALGRPGTGRWQLVHPSLADHVCARLPEERLRAWCSACLRALPDVGEHAARRAVLAERAGDAREEQWCRYWAVRTRMTHDLSATIPLSEAWIAGSQEGSSQHALAWCCLAQAQMLAGHIDTAEQTVASAYRASLRSGSNVAIAVALLRRAELAAYLDETDEYTRLLREALRVGPKRGAREGGGFAPSYAWTLLATSLADAGDLEAASDAIERAIETADRPSPLSQAISYKAYVQLRQGRVDAADQTLQLVDDIDAIGLSVYSVSLQLRAEVALHRGQLERALEILDESLSLREWAGLPSPYGHRRVAEIAMAVGRLELARTHLDEVSMRRSTGRPMWVLRAALAAHMGDFEAVAAALDAHPSRQGMLGADQAASAIEAAGRTDLAQRWRSAVFDEIGPG